MAAERRRHGGAKMYFMGRLKHHSSDAEGVGGSVAVQYSA